MKTVSLLGYTNKLSGRPGDEIDFKVSNQSKSLIKAQLFRSISADPNPKGAGIVEESCDTIFPVQTFIGQNQLFFPGSYGKTAHPISINAKAELKLALSVWPTQYCAHNQTLLGIGETELFINQHGHVELLFGDHVVTTPKPLILRHW